MATMIVLAMEQIEAFKQEMKGAGADFQFTSYPGVIHSCMNPDADIYAKNSIYRLLTMPMPTGNRGKN